MTTPRFSISYRDLKKLSKGSKRGRRATYTSENFLRALIVHNLEGTSFRKIMVRIAQSLFLQDFIRFGSRPVMDYTTIDKAFKRIQTKTWEKMNELLTQYALGEGRIEPSTLRVDTTVVESNIHFPTDSSLLWDFWRVLYR
jgi:IS5 family transposase